MWTRDRRSSFPLGGRAAVAGVLPHTKASAVQIPATTKQSVTGHPDERGNAMVEYALIIFLISIVGLVGLSAVGGASLNLYDVIGDALAEIFG